MRTIRTLACAAAWLLPLEAAAQVDNGDFWLDFEPAQTEFGQTLQSFLQSHQGLQSLVADMNASLGLPLDVPVRFGPGDPPGSEGCPGPDWCKQAYFQPDARDPESNELYDPVIFISYRFVEDAGDIFYEHDEDFVWTDEFVEQMLMPVVYETVWHEMGHAFIDLYGLRGRIEPGNQAEEIAADQLVVYIVDDFYSDTQFASELIGPVIAQYEYRQEAGRSAVVADPRSEHPRDIDRAVEYVCLLYGSNPEAFGLDIQQVLQANRLEPAICVDHFNTIKAGWEAALAPWRLD